MCPYMDGFHVSKYVIVLELDFFLIYISKHITDCIF